MPLSMPRSVQKSVAIYHLGTTAGATQTYTLDTTVMGAMLPLDRREHALEGGDMVDPFELYVESTVDIRVTDKLVIDSVNYYVKKVFVASFGGMPHKRASISTQS